MTGEVKPKALPEWDWDYIFQADELESVCDLTFVDTANLDFEYMDLGRCGHA